MKLAPSLHSIFRKYTLLVTLTALGLWSVVWVQAEYSTFKKESDFLRENYINEQKQLLQNQVAGVVDYINYMSSRTTLEVKAGIRQRVNEAYDIATNIYLQNRDKSSPAVIQQMIKDALRPIRFNHDRGYYFIFNLNGLDELFVHQPELEGTSVLDFQGAKGEYFIRDMLNLIKTQTEGFHQYTWEKPGHHGEKYPKISYIKLFEPYGWILGTGEYFDDTALELQDETLERIVSLRFGREGYFFGSTFRSCPYK